MKISIIAAVAENMAIGKNNQLPWHISDDLILFKRVTINHVVVMGRKSYESIGKPLPKRTNVVVTRKRNYQPKGVLVFHSLNEVFKHFNNLAVEELLVLGGGEIYRQSLDDAHILHISHVHTIVKDADTFFPKVKWEEWDCIHEETHDQNETNDYGFTYKVYQRKLR